MVFVDVLIVVNEVFVVLGLLVLISNLVLVLGSGVYEE